MPEVKSRLEKNGVDLEKITFIEGWYNKTLNEGTKKKLSTKKAAIVLIDVDLYESTVPVLDFITAYLQTGTILIFDDWFAYRGDPRRGEQRAIREWLKRNPNIELIEFYHYSWGGNSFIVNLKNDANH